LLRVSIVAAAKAAHIGEFKATCKEGAVGKLAGSCPKTGEKLPKN